MANIAFISPYDQFALGVRYLSSALKPHGHNSRIIALNRTHTNRDPKALEKDAYQAETAAISKREYGLLRDSIKDFEADFIGVTLASQSYGLCVWMTEQFRKDFPGVPILWGGSDPTLHPELGIEHCDFLAHSESEDSLPELMQLVGEGKDATQVEGFWVRNGETIHRNPRKPLIQDLDRLPFPDYDLEEKFLIENDKIAQMDDPYYVIMTQRGCPYRCTFCINSTLPGLSPGQKYVRRRSVQNVMEELLWIKKKYPTLHFIEFYDDIFTVSKRWLKEFAPLYRDEIGLPFWCFTYPGQCDDSIAAMLKDMGVGYVHFGVQSGSERTLKEVYRRSDPEGVVETTKTLNRHGIPAKFDLIGANPMETDEDHLETLEVLLEVPHPFRTNPMNPLAFYFNSPITKMAQERGIALKPVVGANAYRAVDDNNFEFWKALFDLTQYPHVDDDFLRRAAHNEYFRQNPEVLVRFQKALQDCYWETPADFSSKQYRIDMLKNDLRALQAENERLKARIGGIEGKRLYKAYKKIRAFLPGGGFESVTQPQAT